MALPGTNGGGGSFDANDAPQLEAALQQAVALTYRVLDENGEEVYQGPIKSLTQLPVGDYTIELSDESSLTITKISVTPGMQTVVELSAQGESMTAAVLGGR